jgi:ribokinase
MQSLKAPVVVVGSINIDLVANADRIPVKGETILGHKFQIHPGGKGANQAVAVARLGHAVTMIGRVGDDAFGVQLRAHLESMDVNLSGVTTTPGTSGVAIIVVGRGGENSIVITPGANALLTPEDLDTHIDIIRSAGVVLTQLEIPIETVQHLAKICQRERVSLILDPAPAKELPESLFKDVEWFTPNETEASFFAAKTNGKADITDPASMAQRLIERGVKGVILKLGARGAYIATRDGLAEMLAPFSVDAVDTTAAGDAFNGAFATGLLMKMEPIDSARFAAAAAAISVTRSGAQPSMPTMEDLQTLREQSADPDGPQGSNKT